MREVAAEVVEDGAVLGEAEQLADQFDGEDLTVGQCRRWPALSQAVMSAEVGQPVVKQAEGHYNKDIQVQGECPPIGGFRKPY